jgi:pseudomonalisin
MPNSWNKLTNAGRLVARAGSVFLGICASLNGAQAQTWVSTATQAYPVKYLSSPVLLGALAPSTSMHIVVGLQEQNANLVQPTLKRMLTPGDPLFGTSLTVPQFVKQFGATAAQVKAVESYLSSMGFTNITAADNNLLIEADGTAGNVESAFDTKLEEYTVKGATVYVNTTAARVPKSLSGIVIAVLGLNNVVQLHTDLVKPLQTSAHAASGSVKVQPATDPCTPPAGCAVPDSDNSSFTPQQYQIAYDAACPSDKANCSAKNLATGKSTEIGIIAEGDLTQVVKDLRTAETTYGLPEVPVTIVNAGIASADTSGATEWDLDSQSSTGIANQVQHLYFYAATSMTDSDLIGLAVNKAVTSNQVKAFNMSFGECEFFAYIDGSMQLADQVFGEAALQGITPFAAADDNGSACPSEGPNGVPLDGPPDTAYPASSPYVVAVGGTNLFTNTDYTYDYEIAWEASGGGISYFENSPFWQAYTGTGTLPIVLSSENGDRGVPDVSMCAGGSEEPICAAIVWSAPNPSTPSYNNPIDVIGGGPQPTNKTGCTVASHCVVTGWVTNSNDPSMTDISSNITASFYFMPNGGGTPLTPNSATGLICLADTDNLITTTTYAQIAANCVAGGGVALLLYPVSNISAPSTIPVFAIATDTLGNFLANTVGYNATTSISNFQIRIDAKTAPGATSSLVAGTSLSSPLAMGSWARIETSHGNKLGFASPLIYQLANGAAAGPPPVAASSNYFNDVILGTNGGYSALPGYDNVTGLGSWDIYEINKVIPSTYPE